MLILSTFAAYVPYWGGLVKTLNENELVILKNEFPEIWNFLGKKLAYPYEYFKSFQDFDSPNNILTKENYFSILKNDYLENDDNMIFREQMISLKLLIIQG